MKQSSGLFQPEPRNSKAKLLSQVIVRTKHIHSYDFHSSSDESIVTKKVISDDSLYSALKNSENIKLVKVLSNETHLHFPIETATLHTVSMSQDIISGRWLKSCLKWKPLSFRMSVDVWMESWWVISVIEVFSISYWAFLVDVTRNLMIFLDDRSLSDHHFWAMITLKTALSKKISSRYTRRFKVRNLRRFLKIIFLHLISVISEIWS